NGRTPEYQGLLLPVQTFPVDRETHRLFAVEQNGRAALLRASTPYPVQRLQDLLVAFGRYNLRFVSPARERAVDAALNSARDAITLFLARPSQVPVDQWAGYEGPAVQALRALRQAMLEAVNDIHDSWVQIVAPDHQVAPAGLTADQLA